MNLVSRIYENSKAFPKDEIYGLTLQIRRSAVSIPSNIAEGCGRRTGKDFKFSWALHWVPLLNWKPNLYLLKI